MTRNYLKTLLIIAMAVTAATASAYDFMADGLAYLINADGTTATVTYLERRKSTNYDQLTTAAIPAQVTDPATGRTYTVTTIGESAFYSNKTITRTEIPPTITRMEKDAFGSSGTKNNVYITDLARWCAIEFANDGANPLYARVPLYLNGQLVSELTLPQGITMVNNFAFVRCKSLTKLIVDADVPSIDRHAFYNCTSLTDVQFNGNVTRIDSSAFQNCSKLATLKLPATLDIIGPSAFASCTSLITVELPAPLRQVTKNAFKSCSNLLSVTLGDNVEIIGSSAFSGCTKLASFNIPPRLRAIGSNAFNNCKQLMNFDLPITCSDVRNNAFEKTGWFEAQPDGETYAGYVAYEYKGTMPENYHLVLRDSIVGIAQYAFYNQKNLTKITLPFSVYDLGGWCFDACSNLQEVHAKMNAPRFTPSQYNLYGAWTVFYQVNLSNAILYVPIGCKANYENAEGWNQFGQIIEEGGMTGDVTGDLQVDIADVNAIINVMLGKTTDPSIKAVADVTGDGAVDIADVNMVINIMLGNNIFD